MYRQLHLRMHRDSTVALNATVQEKRVVHMAVDIYFLSMFIKKAVFCMQEEERGVEGRRVRRMQGKEKSGKMSRVAWVGSLVELGWVELGWIGLSWIGLSWVGLDWVGLG